MRDDNVLILFTKAPCICRVKTRMQPALSYRESLYLHKKLTTHAINQFRNNKDFKLIVYTTQVDKIRYQYPYKIKLKEQVGLNLGMKMNHAIKYELNSAQRVLLIGSDFLNLNLDYIQKAFALLSHTNDVVIGPTIDGGYGLIGMSKQNEFLFKHMSWGTLSVLDKTIRLAQRYGRNINALEKISDLDTIDDLHQLENKMTLPNWMNPLLQNRIPSLTNKF